VISVHRVVRGAFGVATVASAAIGYLVAADPRWYALSGLLGTIWWLWDTLVEWVGAPLGGVLARLLHGGGSDLPAANLRPTASDTIRRLEARLETPASPEADVADALRLADLYRAVLKDEVRAEALIGLMRQRYPGNAALARYSERRDEGGEASA
jgi:hypothetical protein